MMGCLLRSLAIKFVNKNSNGWQLFEESGDALAPQALINWVLNLMWIRRSRSIWKVDHMHVSMNLLILWQTDRLPVKCSA